MVEKVGERIRYFRQMKGLSQEKLALMSNLNPAFLGHLERGLKCPTIKTLDKIIQNLSSQGKCDITKSIMRYTSDLTDSQWEIIKAMLKEAGYRSVEEKKKTSKCCTVSGKNGMPVERYAERFSELENSIQLLPMCLLQRNVG